jgi:hypothetical protein
MESGVEDPHSPDPTILDEVLEIRNLFKAVPVDPRNPRGGSGGTLLNVATHCHPSSHGKSGDRECPGSQAPSGTPDAVGGDTGPSLTPRAPRLYPNNPFDRECFEPQAPSNTPNFTLWPLEFDSDMDETGGSAWARMMLTITLV